METKTDILKELALLSPLIAEMKKVNVFTVPEGYFDHLATTVVACLSEENPGFNHPGKIESADVPVGYFDHLAGSILNKIKSGETALEEISNLSPVLHALQQKNVFEAPGGYFESVSQNVIDKVKTPSAKEELKSISPFVSGIENKAVFEVPDGYFTNLTESILRKIQLPAAKVISMRRRSLFIKYAVAAMMTGVLALGLYKYIDKPGSGLTAADPIATLDSSIEKGKDMDDKQFNEALQNLTEADIAKYLESNGDIADVTVLRNNIEGGNLPSQEDYLLDGSTLDNYLKQLDKTIVNN